MNDELQKDVRYLSLKCELFDGQYENLYEWKDRFVDIRLNIEEEMYKLESFSRRNNIHLFTVYEGPYEENAACVREEVQSLNRFYSSS